MSTKQKPKLRIRDSSAYLNNDTTTHIMDSGSLDIINEDDRVLFSINLVGSQILIHSGAWCKDGDKLLDKDLIVQPCASNCVLIGRSVYQEK